MRNFVCKYTFIKQKYLLATHFLKLKNICFLNIISKQNYTKPFYVYFLPEVIIFGQFLKENSTFTHKFAKKSNISFETNNMKQTVFVSSTTYLRDIIHSHEHIDMHNKSNMKTAYMFFSPEKIKVNIRFLSSPREKSTYKM